MKNKARTRYDARRFAQIYRKTEILRAVQFLLGHAKLGSTFHNLGNEVDDALNIAEQVERQIRF